MTKRHIPRLMIVVSGLVLCAALSSPMVIIFGVPLVREWQIQRSIVLAEGARYLFNATEQYGGNYKQKNMFYWSQRPISEMEEFYEDYTVAPFLEVSSNNDRWLIAAWKGSHVNQDPIRRVLAIHTDLCDYQALFNCMSIVLLDTHQSSLPWIVQSMYSSHLGEIQALPNDGTLIVFSYNLPDPA